MRTIPARAGETRPPYPPCRVRWDHPRSRGGNQLPSVFRLPSAGPSPLARGKLVQRLRFLIRRGTIPARAGETGPRRSGSRSSGDHPRSRGGNPPRFRMKNTPGGPSPLARGKLSGSARDGHDHGTIPARAGETRSAWRWPGRTGDHPRSRGGNTLHQQMMTLNQGPSPLARGKRFTLLHRCIGVGTIPARAGETPAGTGACGCRRDHPRSRGGNHGANLLLHSLPGPSPLARGKPSLLVPFAAYRGTIPARAGETWIKPRRRPWRPDHPRSRGGNTVCIFYYSMVWGPSPLARGKRRRKSRRRLGRRTIPARAGETSW